MCCCCCCCCCYVHAPGEAYHDVAYYSLLLLQPAHTKHYTHSRTCVCLLRCRLLYTLIQIVNIVYYSINHHSTLHAEKSLRTSITKLTDDLVIDDNSDKWTKRKKKAWQLSKLCEHNDLRYLFDDFFYPPSSNLSDVYCGSCDSTTYSAAVCVSVSYNCFLGHFFVGDWFSTSTYAVICPRIHVVVLWEKRE